MDSTTDVTAARECANALAVVAGQEQFWCREVLKEGSFGEDDPALRLDRMAVAAEGDVQRLITVCRAE